MKEKYSSSLTLFSWAIYDWGNGAFASVIQTFIFATYFIKSVAADPTSGSAGWGTVTGVAALIVGLSSPVLGAIADQGGGRKIWLGVLTWLCIIPTAMLWWIKPSPEYTNAALILVGIGSVGAEAAYVFYNALLPELAAPQRVGHWSGWGWGLGYVGGMTALIVSLLGFINGDISWLHLNHQTDEHVRATFVLSALWYAIFSTPLFLFTPSVPSSGKPFLTMAREGILQLWTTINQIKKYRLIARFLLARMIYVDGLATLFAFGGIYAATEFGMSIKEVLLFGIAMNISAGVGAALLAFFDIVVGSRQIILLSLVGLIVPGILALVVREAWQFWLLGLVMTLFVGPVQASSRTLLANTAPAHLRREMFGFFMFSGKATAFFGPLVYGWVTYFTGSLRWGMSTIILLFLIGGLLILTLPRTMGQLPSEGGECL